MNELIQVSPRKIGDDSTQTVNARELHAFLEVGKVFAAWIQDRITQYGFVEGRDFALTVSKTGIRQNVIQKDYHLTLDMAKELAMVERNDKGKQARQYFIECERKAKSAAPLIPQSLPEALRLAADLADQKAKAEAALALAAPKAMALDLLETGSDGSFCLTDAAKHLKVPPRKFSARLQQMGWIYRRPMGTGWLAYQARLAAGVMEHKVSTGDKSDGSGWSSTQVRVTAKGMAKLALIFVQEGDEVMCT